MDPPWPSRRILRGTSVPVTHPVGLRPRLTVYPPHNETSMSERKYRLRGYQDDDRDRQPKPTRPAREPGAPAGARRISQDGPRNINMPGFREVVRCAPCGTTLDQEVGFESRCTRCGTDLHTCSQCGSFDPSARFECMQPVPVRVTQKKARNTCTLFTPRTTVERQTTTPRGNVDDPRKAFDDLFKL